MLSIIEVLINISTSLEINKVFLIIFLLNAKFFFIIINYFCFFL